MGADLIVVRRFLEGGAEWVEETTWRHVPDPDVRWRYVKRWLRPARLERVENTASPDGRGRALPGWCAPNLEPNRWLWIQASHPAADLASVEPDEVRDGTRFFGRESPYWDYYALPLRAGVVLV